MIRTISDEARQMIPIATGTDPQDRDDHDQGKLEQAIPSSQDASIATAPMSIPGAGRRRFVRIVLTLITAWGVLSISAVTAFILTNETNPDNRAIIKMGVALILVWCVLGGVLMLRFRDRFVAWATRIPLGWRTRFVLLCIAFAMLEEAVTTSLTNLAPLFGGVTEAARITASKNYLEVVFLNSVIAFVPMFVCWGWLLSRYDFRPSEVLLLFGLNGTLAETLSFGPQNLLQVGMWVWVYGLMATFPPAPCP